MNLIFNEYLNFLSDKGVNISKYNLQEGFYWLDRQIIKAYDSEGNIRKILRLYIDDNLDISVKEYKNKPFVIESWYATIKRRECDLKEIEDESLSLIKDSLYNYCKTNLYTPKILSSGGKDSRVVTHLARKINKNIGVIFNNTTLDCADTYLHIKNIENVQTINPKEGFYQWRDRLNFIPTRFNRACCSIFKEGAMVDYLGVNEKYLFFMGMRNEESNTRSSYGDEWKNHKWNNREWNSILPIRKWTEVDVWLYMLWRNIEINEKYKKGYSRVGWKR